jgi:annexin A7/11
MSIKQLAKECYDAMEGWGTNEGKLIAALCTSDREDLESIQKEFKKTYGKDLADRVKSETSGHLQDVLLGILKTRFEYLSDLMKGALGKINTDEWTVTLCLCLLSDVGLDSLAKCYQKRHDRVLITDVHKMTSGDFGKLMDRLLDQALRKDGRVKGDEKQLEEDVIRLHTASKGMGTDESEFVDIFGGSSREYLLEIAEAYKVKYGVPLTKVVKDELGGDLKRACLALLQSEEQWISDQLFDAMDGAGTNDKHLIRLVVAERGLRLQAAADIFVEDHEISLDVRVGKELSGDYGKAMDTLITSSVKR